MTEKTADNRSLYERIGGEAVVDKLIDRFYGKVTSDPELAPFFKHSPMENLLKMQKEFFCTALDGPQGYFGLSVVKAHQGRGIKMRHCNLFAQHLLESLKELKISEEDVQAVVARINLRVNDVVGESLASD